MRNISYEEIRDWQQFEELVAEYFRSIKEIEEGKVHLVDVWPSGTGPDGGRDLLVDMVVADIIRPVTRRWLLQCKFEDAPTSPRSIGEIDLTTLIHSYKADGYLLIVKNRPTHKLVELFERLNKNCRLGYRYEIWTGEQFINKLLVAPRRIHQQFFPEYYTFIVNHEKRGGNR